MGKKLPQRDPIGAYQRKATAARHVGANKQCACGETQPEALIRDSKPTMCAACKRKKRRQKTLDLHHVAGRSNSPATILVPVNDHRAILSPAQYDWPQETLENPDGSPLLAAAGCIRGFADTLFYLVNKLLLWVPDLLETTDGFLRRSLGPRYWRGTELEKFKPGRGSNG